MKSSLTEAAVQLTIVILTIWYLLFAQSLGSPVILWKQGFGADFIGYLEFAKGNAPFHWYKPYVAYVFKPFLLLKQRDALDLWFGLLTASYMIMCHFVMKAKYGWILCLAGLKIFWFSLGSGNIGPLIYLALLSPWTAPLAVLVKPHLAIIAFGVALLASIRECHSGSVADS